MTTSVSDNQAVLHGISSMATKALLAELSTRFLAATGLTVQIESVGGVDAAKRVQSGEAFDMVLLSSDALQRLIETGHVQANSDCDWAYSNVAVAVPAGHAIPAIHTAEELKQLVLTANKLSYSTGPSGHYLSQLFSQWGIADALKQRIVVPPPGVPVASLLAQGEVDVGFQQRSELMHQPGIALVGDLPDEIAYTTVFSAGVGLAAVNDLARLQAVRDFFHFISAQEQSDCRLSFGMR